MDRDKGFDRIEEDRKMDRRRELVDVKFRPLPRRLEARDRDLLKIADKWADKFLGMHKEMLRIEDEVLEADEEPGQKWNGYEEGVFIGSW